MSAPEIFRVGDDRLLCDHWHARTRTVVLRPADPFRPVASDSIGRVVDDLARRGVDRVLTAALTEHALVPFGDAGFVLHESLRVFRHDLDTPTPSGRVRTSKGTPRRDLAAVAALDERAFAAATPLDSGGIRSVLAATPRCRFRTVEDRTRPGRPAGYAISGIAADTGYVQRIAVEPDRRRSGIARALVTDALAWFRRRHLTRALVNTQVTNEGACRLYLSTGFVADGQRLAVWAWQRAPAR